MKDHVGDHKIKSVDLYTSQNPCSVDTFTAKKVKDPPQSSSCTDSIFAYAKANPDVKVNTFYDQPYNPQSNRYDNTSELTYQITIL